MRLLRRLVHVLRTTQRQKLRANSQELRANDQKRELDRIRAQLRGMGLTPK